MANLTDTPQPKSIAAFLDALAQHNQVRSGVRRNGEGLLDVALLTGQSLVVNVTNIYVVGVADVVQAIRDHAGMNAFVTLSAWNMVSTAAWEYGRDRQVGVFTWSEFFGAINYKKYWLYQAIPLHLKGAELARERKRRNLAWN